MMREKVMEALKNMKNKKAPGSTDVYAEMILAKGDSRIGKLIKP